MCIYLYLRNLHTVIIQFIILLSTPVGFNWASARQSSRLSTLYDVGGIFGGASGGLLSVS